MKHNKINAPETNVTHESIATKLRKILDELADMERKGETRKKNSGEIIGPLNSKTIYKYRVKLGMELDDLPFSRGFKPRPKPRSYGTIKPKR